MELEPKVETTNDTTQKRFKVFDHLESLISKFDFMKESHKQLGGMEIWNMQRIIEACQKSKEAQVQIAYSLSTVACRSYLSHIEDCSYVSRQYLLELFQFILENDPNTDVIFLMTKGPLPGQSLIHPPPLRILTAEQPIDESSTNTEHTNNASTNNVSADSQKDTKPKKDSKPSKGRRKRNNKNNHDNKQQHLNHSSLLEEVSKVTADNIDKNAYVVQGLIIVSDGYNLCGALPLELKDKYITLDMICSREGTKGVGTFLLSSFVACAISHSYELIGLQVAGSMDPSKVSAKRIVRKGYYSNMEACCFYEKFGFKYDNRPRDEWACFDPRDYNQTTMTLDLTRLSIKDDVSKMIERKYTPPPQNAWSITKAIKPIKAHKRKRKSTTPIVKKETKRRRKSDSSSEMDSSPPPSPPPSSPPQTPAFKPLTTVAYPKIRDIALSAVQHVLSDGVPRTTAELFQIITKKPYNVHFGGQSPRNTLSSILTQEIQKRSPYLQRLQNVKPFRFALKKRPS